jgi:hypothetical protein
MIRRLKRTDDTGTSLVIVLILITVIAVVMSAVLAQADTSVRATVALRGQASGAYSSDGAAQAAINQLRADNFNNVAGGCTATTTETLPNFYPATNGDPSASAAVRCTPDPANTGSSGGGANSSPGSAILTLSTGAGGERGIYLNSSASASVKVRGGIFSDSTIFLEGNKSDLENTNTTNSYVYAMGACTTSGTSKIISTPAKVCNYSSNPISASDCRGKDPGTIAGHGLSFNAPAAPTAVGTMAPAACGAAKAVYEFQPGLYTSAAALNALTDSPGGCAGSVWHFNPGKYFFNFKDGGGAASHKWSVSSGYLVGGTATASPFTVVKVAAQTGPRCVAPVTTSVVPNTGVEFVFGSDSRMDVKKGGASANPDVQICASNSGSGPPIAVYGLKSTIGAGGFQVDGESGCITQAGYINQSDGLDTVHCAVLQTYNDPNPALTIYGTTYVPNAVIDLYLNNNTVQVFRWGLVTRSLLIGSTGSSSLASAVIDVPDDAPAAFALPNIMFLDVFVCPGQSTCDTSGTVRLRAKVQLSATTPTTVTVLSWSQQR